jgi:hypothetical protein
VKMNLRWLAVALLLATVSVPATLMADGNPFPHHTGIPVSGVQNPAPAPDGNPFPHVKGTPASRVQNPAPPPDGNPFPHVFGSR